MTDGFCYGHQKPAARLAVGSTHIIDPSDEPYMHRLMLASSIYASYRNGLQPHSCTDAECFNDSPHPLDVANNPFDQLIHAHLVSRFDDSSEQSPPGAIADDAPPPAVATDDAATNDEQNEDYLACRQAMLQYAALHLAIKGGHTDIVRLMVGRGTPLEASEPSDERLVVGAKCPREESSLQSADHLEGHLGWSTAAFDRWKDHPTLVKVWETDYQIAAVSRLTLALNRMVTAITLNALHRACYHGRYEIAKYLIEECGCDPHMPTLTWQGEGWLRTDKGLPNLPAGERAYIHAVFPIHFAIVHNFSTAEELAMQRRASLTARKPADDATDPIASSSCSTRHYYSEGDKLVTYLVNTRGCDPDTLALVGREAPMTIWELVVFPRMDPRSFMEAITDDTTASEYLWAVEHVMRYCSLNVPVGESHGDVPQTPLRNPISTISAIARTYVDKSSGTEVTIRPVSVTFTRDTSVAAYLLGSSGMSDVSARRALRLLSYLFGRRGWDVNQRVPKSVDPYHRMRLRVTNEEPDDSVLTMASAWIETPMYGMQMNLNNEPPDLDAVDQYDRNAVAILLRHGATPSMSDITNFLSCPLSGGHHHLESLSNTGADFSAWGEAVNHDRSLDVARKDIRVGGPVAEAGSEDIAAHDYSACGHLSTNLHDAYSRNPGIRTHVDSYLSLGCVPMRQASGDKRMRPYLFDVRLEGNVLPILSLTDASLFDTTPGGNTLLHDRDVLWKEGLLELGFPPSLRNNDGFTPLHMAALNADERAMHALLSIDHAATIAELKQVAEARRDELYESRNEDIPQLAQMEDRDAFYILRHLVRILMRGNASRPPLTCHSISDFLAKLFDLITEVYTIDVKVTDGRFGLTPAHLAAIRNASAIWMIAEVDSPLIDLIDWGAQTTADCVLHTPTPDGPRMFIPKGSTPLHLLFQHSETRGAGIAIQKLYEKVISQPDTDVNAQDATGRTFMHYAVQRILTDDAGNAHAEVLTCALKQTIINHFSWIAFVQQVIPEEGAIPATCLVALPHRSSLMSAVGLDEAPTPQTLPPQTTIVDMRMPNKDGVTPLELFDQLRPGSTDVRAIWQLETLDRLNQLTKSLKDFFLNPTPW